ncbi:hypothetical protein CDAR_25951 [Caerostris darwini]|uniref:Uncharacterized protein n=1 Tax=Caerostris darwini TaxID=1538125 RepID=A0AAV4PG67_9ARAC|nr:hypothetical protein CDAR_25951 [Caerostris darwini]
MLYANKRILIVRGRVINKYRSKGVQESGCLLLPPKNTFRLHRNNPCKGPIYSPLHSPNSIVPPLIFGLRNIQQTEPNHSWLSQCSIYGKRESFFCVVTEKIVLINKRGRSLHGFATPTWKSV